MYILSCFFFYSFVAIFVTAANLPILNVPVPVPNDKCNSSVRTVYHIWLAAVKSKYHIAGYEQKVRIFAVTPKDLIDAQAVK
jgi:hypothetical protein